MFRPLLLLLLSSVTTWAANYYVAPGGDDASAGTLEGPWRTVQKAANTLQPGDTVFVRAGTYEKVTVNVSGSAAGGYVTFRNYDGETPIIDGTGVVPPDDDTALFLIRNRNYVRVEGFTLQNYQTALVNRVPAGIFVTGACQHLRIVNCDVHDIWNTGGDADHGGNAFGIAVYGTAVAPITDLEIDGCRVHHLKTGQSESLSVNGNVSGFRVTNNQVHDNNNIGIVFIGYEKTCPRVLFDRARNGVCSGNSVWNITSEGNQGYTPGDFSAGGIYCDGAAAITIERNVVRDCDIGIELASEHAGRVTAAIIARDNFVSGSRQVGLALGGYAAKGTGGTTRCYIANNTFLNNDSLGWGNGEVTMRFRTSNCVFRNNIFMASAGTWAVTVPVGAAQNVRNRFDYNLYFADGTGRWKWNNRAVNGLAAWQKLARVDGHALFTDPKLVSTGASPDLHLGTGSPAIDAGDPTYRGTGETDIDGNPRMAGGRVDIGADEVTAN